MRLSDVMSQMGLASFAEAGLVLFLFAFVMICLKVLVFSSIEEMKAAARIPLGEHRPVDVRGASSRGTEDAA